MKKCLLIIFSWFRSSSFFNQLDRRRLSCFSMSFVVNWRICPCLFSIIRVLAWEYVYDLVGFEKVMFLHLFFMVFLFYVWLCFCRNRSWFYFFCFARSEKRWDLREKKKREKLSASVFSVWGRRRDFRSNLGFRGRWEKMGAKKKEGKRKKIPSLPHLFLFTLRWVKKGPEKWVTRKTHSILTKGKR